MDVTQLLNLNINVPLGYTTTCCLTVTDQVNRFFFYGCTNGTLTGIRITLSLQHSQFFHVQACKGPIRALAYCKASCFLFVGSDDGTCRIFNPFAVPMTSTTTVLGSHWSPPTGFIQTLPLDSGVVKISVIPTIGLIISTSNGTINFFKQNFSSVPSLIRSALFSEASLKFLPMSSLSGWITSISYELQRPSILTQSPVGILALGDANGSVLIASGEVFLNALKEGAEIQPKKKKNNVQSCGFCSCFKYFGYFSISSSISNRFDWTGKLINRVQHPDKLNFSCISKFGSSEFLALDKAGTFFLFSAVSTSLIRTSVHGCAAFFRRGAVTSPKFLNLLGSEAGNDSLTVEYTFVVSSVTKSKVFSVQKVLNSSTSSNSHTDSVIGIFPSGSGKINQLDCQSDDFDSDPLSPQDEFGSYKSLVRTASMDFLMPSLSDININGNTKLSRKNSSMPLADLEDLPSVSVFETVSPAAFFSLASDNKLILWDGSPITPVDYWILGKSFSEVVYGIFLEEFVSFLVLFDDGVVKMFHAETRNSTEVKLTLTADDALVAADVLYQCGKADPLIVTLSRNGEVSIFKTKAHSPWSLLLTHTQIFRNFSILLRVWSFQIVYVCLIKMKFCSLHLMESWYLISI
ncbi:hypothetical protein GEMRC1_006305 [Eukaryota sp. GEM-RC1]